MRGTLEVREWAETDRVAEFFEERRGNLPGFFSAGKKNLLKLLRLFDVLLVLRTHRSDLGLDLIEELLLRLTPAETVREFGAELRVLFVS